MVPFREAKRLLRQVDLSFTKYAVWLSRADLRILTGLLTGHADLNRHLTLMQIRTDAACPLCQEDEETVLHLLGECSALYAKHLSILGYPYLSYEELHRVSKKTVQNCFCQHFFKFPPILIIFGRKMANRLKLCEVHSFSTSPNSCHHTTVLSVDVPNCYKMLKVVSIRLLTIASSLQQKEGASWFNKFVGLNIWKIFFGILLFTSPKYLTSI